MLFLKMYRTLVVFVSSVVVFALGRVNYCGSKMCGHTNAHTFCMYTDVNDDRVVVEKQDGPGQECKGYMDARLSVSEKARILARLNLRRSAAANGKLRGLPTAGNMLKLRWVEELAREAQRWADQCRPPTSPEEHDDCRDLYSISVGQCVASVVGEAPGLRPETMVDMWYLQSMYYKGNVTHYEPPNESGVGYYGDYAQITWANAFMVGCGRSRFMTSYNGRLRTVERLVCNVSPRGPVPRRALWLPTAPAAACPPNSQRDHEQPTLCSFQDEIIELDTVNLFPIEERILLNTLLDIERNESRNYLGSLDELYLTNLAIATLTNRHTTNNMYNSIQKRDIVQKINENVNRTMDFEYNETVTIITTNDIKATVATSILQKVITVGRPKSYKIDELSDVIEEKFVDNNVDKREQFEDLTNKEKELKELYGDYEFSEGPEDAKSGEEFRMTTILDQNAFNTTISSDTVTTVEVDERKATQFNDTNMNIIVDQNIQSNLSANSDFNDTIIKGKSIEDYLSDPETVRQLQEELDRMENALATPLSTSGKVRRELREEPRLETTTNKEVAQETTKPTETEPKTEPVTERMTEKPSTEEQRPATEVRKTQEAELPKMFNMVMKYMPYLKEYKNNVIKRAVSSTVLLKPGFKYVLTIVFMFTCLIL